MTHTFEIDLYSDLHKDVFGFRPREHWFYAAETTDDERQLEWDTLTDMLAAIIEDERDEQLRAATRFESEIDRCISLGADNRGAAIRWLKDAADVEDDDELEWFYGLRFGYIADTEKQ